MKPSLTPMTADLTTLLNTFREVIFNTLNCHKVGKIVSFDSANQTAQVEMIIQKKLNNVILEYPVLVDCPVFVLSGGNARITMPISAGDSCLVLFNDEDMDNWFATGAKQEALTNRKHSFTDALVIVGFRHQANKISDYNSSNLEIHKGNAIITVADDKVEVTDGTAKITVTSGNITIQGGNININGTLSINGVPYLSHMHTGVTGGSGTTGGVAS